jgi:hypothetical protein
MSNPKPFLEPDDVYARLKELERVVKALHSGRGAPHFNFAMQPNSSVFANITSGAYADVFNAGLIEASADAIRVTVPWVTDAGTTGSVQLYNNVVGGSATSEVALAANSGGFIEFNWLHKQPPTHPTPFQPTIRAKRTGGAGNVTLWVPSRCWCAPSSFITAATVAGV